MLQQDHGDHHQGQAKLDGGHFRLELVLKEGVHSAHLPQPQHAEESEESEEAGGSRRLTGVQVAKLQEQICDGDSQVNEEPSAKVVKADGSTVRYQIALIEVAGEEWQDEVHDPVQHGDASKDIPGLKDLRHIHIDQLERETHSVLVQIHTVLHTNTITWRECQD